MVRSVLVATGRIIRWTFLSLWGLVPFIISILRAAFWLMATAVASLWRGVPEATTIMAEEWTGPLASFITPNNMELLIAVGRVAAFGVILLGWVILALFTSLVIGLIF